MTPIRALWALCRLRAGPQDLPYSPALAATWLALLLALQGAMATQAGLDGSVMLGRVAVSIALLVALPRALLRWRGLGNRSAQTIAAFAGSSVVFALLVLPIALQLQPLQPGTEPTLGQFLLALLGLALFVWKLRVDAHIWRNALDLSRGAMTLAMGLMLLEVLLLALLTPSVPSTVNPSP